MKIQTRQRLDAALKAVCPIDGTSGSDPTRIDFAASATAQQITDAQAVLSAFDFSQSADDAWTLSQIRALALALPTEAVPIAIRALLLMILDEFNLHTTWEAALTAQIAAATSLANLQTRVAAITPIPTRTKANLITAITNKITTGSADSV
jgi:hypothetical protein